jgi:SAM-dependent methyltransferase
MEGIDERQALEGAYRRHHADRRPSGFIFCEPDRVPAFTAWVEGPGLRVLDLGCRDGALTSHYLRGNDVVGVDIDREALAAAAERGIQTVWADLDQPLPFDDGSFDVVVAGEVLEHLRFPEQTLGEARRVLRTGGLLVGSVPNNYRLKSRLRFLLGKPPERDPTILRLFGVSDLERLLEDWGEVEMRCVAGRLVRIRPKWFANDILFRARPGARAEASAERPRQVARRGGNWPARATLAATAIVFVFAILPEVLGDHPYNVFGH